MNQSPRVGARIERYLIAASTNDLARAAAERGEAEGLVITAEEQAAGRGRFGRQWIVPRGSSLQMSVLLRPPLTSAYAARMVRMTALAVAETLEQHLRLAPTLKWSNDVLLNGKKCAGILLESSLRGDTLEYVILGIGVNVNYTMHVYPELAPYATTLQDVLGYEIARAELEHALLNQLDAKYQHLLDGQDFMTEYRARLTMLGQTIRVATATNVLEGIARDVMDDGALLFAHNDSEMKLYAGDVTVLKPQLAS